MTAVTLVDLFTLVLVVAAALIAGAVTCGAWLATRRRPDQQWRQAMTAIGHATRGDRHG